MGKDVIEDKQAKAGLETHETSDRKYRALVENANSIMLTMDRSGRITFLNKFAQRFFGYPEEEILGRKAVGTIVPLFESTGRNLRKLMDDIAGNPDRYANNVNENVRHNGERVWVAWTNRVISNGNGRGGEILCIGNDITEQRRAAEALRASQLKLSDAMDLAHIVYWEVDTTTGEFIFNDPFYAFYGTSAEREGGYRMSREEYSKRFVHPDDMDLFHRAAEKRLVSTEHEYQRDTGHRIIRRNGDVRYINARMHLSRDATGRVTRCYGVNQDITGRKTAEEEIAMLKRSIDTHHDLAFWIDSNNMITYINDAARRLLGYTREELIGKDIFPILPRRSKESMKEIWRQLRKEGSFVDESIWRRKDGTEFPVEVNISHVHFRGRAYAFGFARDITEKKSLRDQLRHSQKMEALGTLAGGVAHDFNNLLTVIMGFGSLIQRGIDPDDPRRAYADQIIASSEKAADLTQSLLAFSRKQEIQVSPHEVNAVVSGTTKLLKRLLPEDVKLMVNVADQDLVVMLDVAQIGQVLMNLTTNARDAMPKGGLLTVSIDPVTLDNEFVKIHGFGRPGRYAMLSVSDTGTGMSAETMARIFEPFFTTKKAGKGTGLGLSSVYGIVKQHDGYITAMSALGKGTTFNIYLPLTDRAILSEALENIAPARGEETILVIEDDNDVRTMMATILSGHGYTVLEAADGEEAITVFNEHGKAIDLVIADVVMPGRNGKEVLDEIARIDPSVKSVFISGYTGDVVLEKGVRKDTVDFLHKPVSLTELLAKVRVVLDRPDAG